jgi:hypothetical protein
MSRPEKWNDKFIQIAEKACELGATDADLAVMLGVCERTISYWRASKPEFAKVLKVGKEVADERVTRSLFARANGYEHDEVDIRVVNGEIVQTPIRKYYPPDTTAAIFWLKNRDPSKWREMKAVELTGKDGGAVEAMVTVEFVSNAPRSDT